jgi:preprotein translocase subunit YajC
MTKVNRYESNKEDVFVTKGGIKYKVLDLGTSTIEIRVKSDKELAKDYKAFAKYTESLK